jgi:hypothetical protein
MDKILPARAPSQGGDGADDGGTERAQNVHRKRDEDV